MNLKQELCNYLIKNDLVKENDVIRHSYSNSRLKEWKKRNVETNNIAPTLDTRCDCLGVVVKDQNMNEIKPRVIGGIGQKKSNGGRQWYMQNRIYDDNIAISIATAFNPYYLVEGDKMLRGGKQVNETIEKNIDKFKEGKILNMDLYNRTVNEEVSQTLTDPTHNSQRLYDGLRIRKLTPKECWRLMGFDDIDFEKASKVNSNAQLYKQAGNSIVVNVLEAILKNLLLETNNDNVIEGQMTIYDFINE